MIHSCMKTSSHRNLSQLLTLCARNSLVTNEFPSQRSVARSFDVFFDLRLNKRLSKQSTRRWFETPWRSLWRHCNVILMLIIHVFIYWRLSAIVCLNSLQINNNLENLVSFYTFSRIHTLNMYHGRYKKLYEVFSKPYFNDDNKGLSMD